MVDDVYVPARGDIVWITFYPRKGREQSGRRPALVLSPRMYNQKVGLVLLCPTTSSKKDYPFEVDIQGEKVSGVVLGDHVHSFNWRRRQASFIEKVHPDVVRQVVKKIMILAGEE